MIVTPISTATHDPTDFLVVMAEPSSDQIKGAKSTECLKKVHPGPKKKIKFKNGTTKYPTGIKAGVGKTVVLIVEYDDGNAAFYTLMI